MIAVLSHVAAFSVGFAFAAWMIRSAVDVPEGGATGPAPGRTPFRDVGGPTAGTCQPRPPRGGCEAGARGRAGAAQDAPPRPPDISSP